MLARNETGQISAIPCQNKELNPPKTQKPKSVYTCLSVRPYFRGHIKAVK